MAAPTMAQNQQPELRIDTKLVTIYTNVTDKTGAIVGGLTKADFKITEDGRPQEIGVFERQSQQHLGATVIGIGGAEIGRVDYDQFLPGLHPLAQFGLQLSHKSRERRRNLDHASDRACLPHRRARR